MCPVTKATRKGIERKDCRSRRHRHDFCVFDHDNGQPYFWVFRLHGTKLGNQKVRRVLTNNYDRLNNFTNILSVNTKLFGNK